MLTSLDMHILEILCEDARVTPRELAVMTGTTEDQVQSAMEGLGISLYDTEGKARSLREVMVDLRSAFAGLSEEEKTQNAYLLGGTSGMNAVLAIAGASEGAFRNLAGAIDHSGGTAVKTRVGKTYHNGGSIG